MTDEVPQQCAGLQGVPSVTGTENLARRWGLARPSTPGSLSLDTPGGTRGEDSRVGEHQDEPSVAATRSKECAGHGRHRSKVGIRPTLKNMGGCGPGACATILQQLPARPSGWVHPTTTRPPVRQYAEPSAPSRAEVPNLHRYGGRRDHAINSVCGGSLRQTRQS